jgi:hypothetical protein
VTHFGGEVFGSSMLVSGNLSPVQLLGQIITLNSHSSQARLWPSSPIKCSRTSNAFNETGSCLVTTIELHYLWASQSQLHLPKSNTVQQRQQLTTADA